MERAFYSTVVMLALSVGCAHKPPETPQPEPSPPTVTEAPPPTKGAPAPPSTAKGKAAPPVTTPAAKTPGPATKAAAAKAPVAKPPTAKPSTPTAKTQTKPAAPPSTAAPPRVTGADAPLDLEALETQLKQTKAIGVFTKLTLKNQVDDLLDKFREHHAGKPTPTVTELRRSYDLLMMKVLSLLQDHDQKLASDIVSSRERIWGLLVDPKAFAALQA
jgi:hypothetical protein